MVAVLISIGSNVDREHNIRGAVSELSKEFSPLNLSGVYESAPVGFEGDNFFNLVAGFETALPLPELLSALRNIEQQYGRERHQQRFGPRTLDLDLLTYGDQVQHDDQINLPRREITEYVFMIKPLAELVPETIHPELGKAYQQLWDEFSGDKESIWPIAINIVD